MPTSPSGKSYIGQTTRPIEKRLEEHRTGKSSDCVAIYNAIQYHGWENFEKEWNEVPDDDLNFYEEMLVALLGTLSPSGYNLKEGGANGKPGEETKQRMSEAHLGEKNHMFGKTHTDEIKQKLREINQGGNNSRYGKKHSEESKKKISEAKQGEKHHMYGKKHDEDSIRKMKEAKQGEKNCMFGKTHTCETKMKISEAKQGEKNFMFGKTHTDETKQKMSKAKQGDKHPRSTKIYQYDTDGNFKRSFGSIGEAVRYLNKNSGTNISKCACGDQETAYGFKWSYKIL